MPEKTRKIIFRIVLLLIILSITALLIIFRDQVKNFEHYGYPGIFLISILSNATLIFPVPGVMFTSAMGAVFNPLGVALASGMGAAIGELTGYLAGYSGQVIIEQREWYEQLTKYMQKYGGWTILVMAFIPNPVFDLAGMAAGMLKMPVGRFLLWCAAGKILKMLFFSYTGASIFNIFID